MKRSRQQGKKVLTLEMKRLAKLKAGKRKLCKKFKVNLQKRQNQQRIEPF